jgi:hypothetical protein
MTPERCPTSGASKTPAAEKRASVELRGLSPSAAMIRRTEK